ncbi:TIGR03905 family TSCPD domain-containing protein [Fusibacter sp. JL216-2]|uniref:TIGR03905 family TSCPD domain-containing protein n=1 Tax=Fusibacter sp. JL216-2 TaxID=3071453 RepID=UPI003D3424AE
MQTFTPSGVCAKQIHYKIDNGIVQNVKFDRGCPGSLQGIAKLVEGMPVEKVIDALKNIQCGAKATSCPDQLRLALESQL